MSQPDPAVELARQIARAYETLAEVQVTLAAHRGQIGQLRRRIDDAGLGTLAARFDAMTARVEEALDAAAPRGPAAPRWDADAVTRGERQAQLAGLRSWVEGVLRPGYIAGGGYSLRECWPEHEIALWELGTAAAWWRYIYGRSRPDTVLALEWNDRWLPGVMRRVAEATRNCDTGHTII